MVRKVEYKLRQRSKSDTLCTVMLPIKYGKDKSGKIYDDLNKITMEVKPMFGNSTQIVITIHDLKDTDAFNHICGEDKTPELVQKFIDTYRWRADNLKLLVSDNIVYNRTVNTFENLTYDQVRYKFDNDPRAQVDGDYRRDLHQAMLRKAKEMKKLGDGS